MVDDGSTDSTAELLAPVCRTNHRRQLERRGVSAARNQASRSRRASCSCFSTRTTCFLRTTWRDSSRRQPLLPGGRLPLRLARSRLRRRARPLRARPAVRPRLGSVPRACRCRFAAHLGARRTSRSRDHGLVRSTRARACRRTGTTGSGWRLPEPPFTVFPGNVAIIRRRSASMSGSAGTQLAVAGLAVLERHLSRHQRCPACIRADAGLRSWRQAVLRSSAQDVARRLHLKGRPGRLVGAAVAVAYRPRLASTAWRELREKRSSR